MNLAEAPSCSLAARINVQLDVEAPSQKVWTLSNRAPSATPPLGRKEGGSSLTILLSPMTHGPKTP